MRCRVYPLRRGNVCQSGESSEFGLLVIRTALAPLLDMVAISQPPPELYLEKICLPSGDHEGSSSLAELLVIWVVAPPCSTS